MKRMKTLFLNILLQVMVITCVYSQRKSRGHIIIIGGSGGGKQVEEKIVHVPVPIPMPCPMHPQIHTKIQKIPMIVKVPVPVRHYHPVPHPVPVPVYKHIPVKQIPIVNHVPVFQKVEEPHTQDQPMYQKIPVFQKEFPEQQHMENEIPITDNHESQDMNSEYQQNESPPEHESGGGQQESRINIILSKLKIKPINKSNINLRNYLNNK